jgi:cytochrome c oxidase subunit 2
VTGRARLLGVASGVALLATGCGSAGLPDSASTQGDDVTSLWRVFLVLAGLIVALIWGLVGWCVIRYRRRDDEIPDQRQYRVPLEVAYTVVPLVLVAVLFVLSVRSERDVSELVDDPDLVVDVLGFQWDWQFTYEGEDVRISGIPGETPVLRLPVGRTIRFELRSDDVIHSFWVPEFVTKRDLIPLVGNAIDIEVTRPGTWPGRCAEYCGLDHTVMDFTVEAMPAEDFDAWLAEAAAGAVDDPTLVPIPPETS